MLGAVAAHNRRENIRETGGAPSYDFDYDRIAPKLGLRWDQLLQRQVDWVAVEDRNLTIRAGDSEQTSLFANEGFLEQAIRSRLPQEMQPIEMQIDLPRHIYRPDALAATAGQNFLYNPATHQVQPLTYDQLFKHLPLAHRACRVYLRKEHTREEARAIGAVRQDHVGVALGRLDELLVHGAHGVQVLLHHRLGAAAALRDVARSRRMKRTSEAVST